MVGLTASARQQVVIAIHILVFNVVSNETGISCIQTLDVKVHLLSLFACS